MAPGASGNQYWEYLSPPGPVFAKPCQYYQRAYDELVTHDDAEGLAAVLSNLLSAT